MVGGGEVPGVSATLIHTFTSVASKVTPPSYLSYTGYTGMLRPLSISTKINLNNYEQHNTMYFVSGFLKFICNLQDE